MSQRAYKEGQITQEIKALEGLQQKDISIHLDEVISNIETNLKGMEGLEELICDGMEETELESVLSSSRVYTMQVYVKLARYKDARDKLATQLAPPSVPSSKATVDKSVILPLPPIQL